MTNTILSADGRQVGERGRKTRDRLLSSLAVELRIAGYRDATVRNVALRARTSPAAFYTYFPDVEQAVLALAQDVAHSVVEKLSLTTALALDRPTVAEAIEAFFALNKQHRALLRVIDMKSAEGDRRFTALRIRFLDGLRVDLMRAVSAAHPAATERAVASAVTPLVLMLAEVAAHEGELEAWSLDAVAIRDCAAELVHTAIAAMPA